MASLKPPKKKNEEVVVKFRANEKQLQALKALNDDSKEEVFYGGAAGGGKSVLGSFWIISNAVSMPGTRWVMGRQTLKKLKKTTLRTFFEVAKNVFGFEAKKQYKYNQTKSVIKFYNGSEVDLIELRDRPEDPDFDRFGSAEYTGAFFDEVSQISHKAKEAIIPRLRYKTEEYGITGKVLFASNPSKNWAYNEFYLPWREGKLPEQRAFIQALPQDNPFLPRDYVLKLKRREPEVVERLLYGNWEYDDDPSALMKYERIRDLFTNDHVDVSIEPDDRYIVADLAMKGRDRFVVTVWNGLVGKVVYNSKKSSGKEIEETLKRFAKKYEVPRSQIIYDEGGLGNYLGSYLKGAKAFNSGATAKDSDKYRNLRSECYYKLAKLVNNAEIYLKDIPEGLKKEISQELEQVKEKHPFDDEKKAQVVSKSKIKDNIGRSPDFADVLMMRMLPEIKSKVFISSI